MKQIFLAIIAAAVALGFTACTQEPTADVKWTAVSDLTAPIHNIQWTKDGKIDQQWTETLTKTSDDTSVLSVSELVGEGDASFLDGSTAIIEIDKSQSTGVIDASTSTATLEENAQVNIAITAVTKK